MTVWTTFLPRLWPYSSVYNDVMKQDCSKNFCFNLFLMTLGFRMMQLGKNSMTVSLWFLTDYCEITYSLGPHSHCNGQTAIIPYSVNYFYFIQCFLPYAMAKAMNSFLSPNLSSSGLFLSGKNLELLANRRAGIKMEMLLVGSNSSIVKAWCLFLVNTKETFGVNLQWWGLCCQFDWKVNVFAAS